MATPRVLILYNQPVLPAHHPDADSEIEILESVKFVEKVLTAAKFGVTKLAVSHDPRALLEGILQFHPDAVFNLFEGTGDDCHNEAFAASLLEWLKVPFTGCPAHALTLAHDKALTKHLLRSAGLPTPNFLVLEDCKLPHCPLEWPLIVKPALQDASIGLDQGSVVCNRQQLEQRVGFLLERFGPPVLVEEFIRGREFNVAVVECPELRVLPVSEILFAQEKSGYWPIVTYDAKWRRGSEEFASTPIRAQAKVSLRLGKRLEEIAKKSFRLTGCRDFGRVDFRVRPPDLPFVLEVNPNPDFGPGGGLPGALKNTGMTHARFAVQMVRNALARRAP